MLVIKQYYLKFILKYSTTGHVIYSCDGKATFSLLRSSLSNNPSEIISTWFGAQETLLMIINIENSCDA